MPLFFIFYCIYLDGEINLEYTIGEGGVVYGKSTSLSIKTHQVRKSIG